jgi:DNA (cytosine-5)-methyltransferase 1
MSEHRTANELIPGPYKPRLLDLFCGAGGAAMGYSRAGFEIVGVDIAPQPNYPFTFVQRDALEYLDDNLLGFFAVVHASPPCQAYSTTKSLHGNEYPELIEPVRRRLKASELPYVIENVVGAPLFSPIKLCGSSFGLGVRRHRLFESNVPLMSTGCRHDLQPEPIDVTGTGGPGGKPRTNGGGIHRKPRNLAHAREVMGIDWMSRPELSEAVPPAYTEFFGTQIIEQLERAA